MIHIFTNNFLTSHFLGLNILMSICCIMYQNITFKQGIYRINDNILSWICFAKSNCINSKNFFFMCNKQSNTYFCVFQPSLLHCWLTSSYSENSDLPFLPQNTGSFKIQKTQSELFWMSDSPWKLSLWKLQDNLTFLVSGGDCCCLCHC